MDTCSFTITFLERRWSCITSLYCFYDATDMEPGVVLEREWAFQCFSWLATVFTSVDVRSSVICCPIFRSRLLLLHFDFMFQVLWLGTYAWLLWFYLFIFSGDCGWKKGFFFKKIPSLWPLKHLLPDLVQRLRECTQQELVPLLAIDGVKRGRARQLYEKGLFLDARRTAFVFCSKVFLNKEAVDFCFSRSDVTESINRLS